MNNLSTNTKLRFTTTYGTGDTLRTAVSLVSTGADGTYSFDLVYGMHMIETSYGGHWNFLGNVNISELTPTTQTINELLENFSVPLPGDETDTVSYKSMNLMGEWDAGTGNFPPNPMYPSRLSDVWTISTGGTMDSGTGYTLLVNENDMVYWSITNQQWQKSGAYTALSDGELPVGGETGAIEATTMASLFAGLVRVYTLDGTYTRTTITHNKNRNVVPMFFNSASKIEYPIYKQIDSNNLEVIAGEPLLGTLIVI